MKAYLIDPVDKLVSQITIGDGFEEIQEHLKCDLFTVACTLDNDDTLYVDDVGLISGKQQEFFMFQPYPSPLAGRGLLLGAKPDGSSADCQTELLDCAMMGSWLSHI